MKIHIVQKGDTLWKLSKQYGVNFEELKAANTQLSNPDMIMPGMKIKIPTGSVPVKKESQHVGKTPIKEQPIFQKEVQTPAPAPAPVPTPPAPQFKPELPKMPTPMPIPPAPQPTPKQPSYDLHQNLNVHLYKPQAKSMPMIPAPPTQQKPEQKKEMKQVQQPKYHPLKETPVQPSNQQPLAAPVQPNNQFPPASVQQTNQQPLAPMPPMQPSNQPLFAPMQQSNQPPLAPMQQNNQPPPQQMPMTQAMPAPQPFFHPQEQCFYPISPVMPGCANCGPMYPQMQPYGPMNQGQHMHQGHPMYQQPMMPMQPLQQQQQMMSMQQMPAQQQPIMPMQQMMPPQQQMMMPCPDQMMPPWQMRDQQFNQDLSNNLMNNGPQMMYGPQGQMLSNQQDGIYGYDKNNDYSD